MRRLYHLLERKEKTDFPSKKSDLTDAKLKAKYEKEPLNKRRHLSTGAQMFFKSFGDENAYWQTQMMKDSTAYQEERSKNKMSSKEKNKWIDDALKKLKKASTEMMRGITHKLKKEGTLANLWLYTQYFVARFYSEITLRNELATVQLESVKKNNYLKKTKGSKYTLIMRDFKASDRIGERKIELSAALSKVVTKYLKYRKKLNLKHNNLLSNSQGRPLTKSGLGKALRAITKDRLNKEVGTRMLRVFNATSHRKLLEAADKLSNEMLHSTKQTRDYVRKKE